MSSTRIRYIAANATIGASIVFAVVGNSVAHARSLGLVVPADRIIGAACVVLFLTVLLQYAYVQNVEKVYERRGRPDGAQLHLEIVAAACVTYWLVAAASGGVTRIAWPALDLPAQFLVFFVGLNLVSGFITSAIFRRESRRY